jgi:hypothetical protein
MARIVTDAEDQPGGEPEPETAEDSPRQVLADLRAARRQQRTQDFDWFEALYRAYITAIVSGVAVWLLSGVTGDTRVVASTATHVGHHDAALIGLAVAVCWAVGLRSGGQGGPLVIEAADVRHVLLSPIERSAALRPVAVRQLRFGALVGAGVGAVAGLLAYRRLPGGAPAWIAVGVVVGTLIVTSSLGLAMLVAGRRLGRWGGSGLAAAVVAWSVVDEVAHTITSPATFVGQVALWPLQFHVTGLIGPLVAIAAVSTGLAEVPGSSLEAAERRATLVGQIRFAATLKDLRTVVVLRRQLAQELPRQRPWVRMPRSVPVEWLAATPGSLSQTDVQSPRRVPPRRWPVWRRGWHGILRFPGLRLLRLAVLGAAAGVALVGVWRGTTPLIAVAGICLYVAGLDAVEPLAQEIDHPDRRDGYSLTNGELQARQLGPSVVVMICVGLFGLLAGYLASGASLRALELGAVLVIPGSLAGLGGAAISVVQGAPPMFSSTDSMLPPEAAGARALFHMAWPPAVAIAGLLPILAGRHHTSGSSVAEVARFEPLVIVLVMLVGVWVRKRDDIHDWFRRVMEDAKAAQRPGPTPPPTLPPPTLLPRR